MSESDSRDSTRRDKRVVNRDYTRYASYETSEDKVVVYDSANHTAWIRMESEHTVDVEEMK